MCEAGGLFEMVAGASNSSLRAYATPASQAETYATFAESGMFGDHALIVKPPFQTHSPDPWANRPDSMLTRT